VSEDISIIEKAAVAIEEIAIIIKAVVVIEEIVIITEEVAAAATDIINVHHLVEVTTTNAGDAVAANPYANG
jgi:hypothetical protein